MPRTKTRAFSEHRHRNPAGSGCSGSFPTSRRSRPRHLLLHTWEPRPQRAQPWGPAQAAVRQVPLWPEGGGLVLSAGCGTKQRPIDSPKDIHCRSLDSGAHQSSDGVRARWGSKPGAAVQGTPPPRPAPPPAPSSLASLRRILPLPQVSSSLPAFPVTPVNFLLRCPSCHQPSPCSSTQVLWGHKTGHPNQTFGFGL